MTTRNLIGVYVSDGRIDLVGLRCCGPKETREASESIETAANAGWEQALTKVPELVLGFKEKCGFQKAYLSIGLPRQAAIVRELRFPKETRENLAGAVKFELPRCIPIPVDQVYYDFQEVSTTRNEQICVLVVAMLREPLAPLWILNETADILFHALAISSTALVALRNWKLADDAPPGPQAMIIRHHGTTEFLVVVGGVLRYAKMIQRIPPAPGSQSPSDMPDLMKEARLAEDQLGLQLPPERLLVISNETPPLDLVQTDPQINGMGSISLAHRNWGFPNADLLVAHGAALLGMELHSQSINLIPDEERHAPSKFGQQLTIVLSIVLLLLVGAWIGIAKHKDIQRNAQLDQKMAALEKEVSAIEATKTRIEELDKRLVFLNQTAGSRQQKLDIIDRLSKIIPKSAWVESVDIRSDQIILKGFADSASDLLPLLEAEPTFENVGFLSSITRVKNGKERFRLSIDIVP